MPDSIESRIQSIEQRLDRLEKSFLTADDIAGVIASVLEEITKNLGKTSQES